MTWTHSKLFIAATIAALLGVGAASLVRAPEVSPATPTPIVTPRRVEPPTPTAPPAAVETEMCVVTPTPAAPSAPAKSKRLEECDDWLQPTNPFEANLQSGVDWFPSRQDADDRWRDSATTGVVLLAFLGAGECHQYGRHHAAIKKALIALRDGRDAEGCLAGRTSMRRLRDHAIAGLAFVEAYGMTGSRVFKSVAQEAVDFAMKTRAPGGAWNFTATHAEQVDVEATVWMAMLMKSAKPMQLHVDLNVLAEVAAALDRITEPTTGRIIGPPNSPATISSDAETAAALAVRALAGRLDTNDPLTAKSADVLVVRPPTAESVDLPYVYFSGVAMLGLAGERTRAWLPGLKEFCRSQLQRSDGSDRGSWDPPDGASENARIWSTAYHLLCLEFYYRWAAHGASRR